MQRWVFIVAWIGLLWLVSPVAAQSVNVFQGLITHINRQIQQDKRAFHEAERCTDWFYRQEKKPPLPKAEGIAWHEQPINTYDCPARYPGGINAAREAFSRTQSALSVSLTFYQFVLVGDRNDDDRYNTAELQDVMESFGLTYNRDRPTPAFLAELEATFDAIHQAARMEKIMAGMNTLYERGYRLTDRDRSAIEHVSK
ncbi:MAG: hypothetical protein FJ248_05515 [Nitrospira sp.]|nr:hypothetical protein [Nitrospira sp.]